MKERAPEEPAAHTSTILIRDHEVAAALRPSYADGICLARDTPAPGVGRSRRSGHGPHLPARAGPRP
ncbi:hypothetical protein ACEZCY_36865 [Streptacidiphilus sp. N1-12]|uniref:Uncharacterized protein n=2 Tax=Streptacidiphilus alkalitolerans TaxID=3342712 RepID=A0ABV6VMD4_9ACTN